MSDSKGDAGQGAVQCMLADIEYPMAKALALGLAELGNLMAVPAYDEDFREFLGVMCEVLPFVPEELAAEPGRDTLLDDLGDSLWQTEVQMFLGEHYDRELSCAWFNAQPRTLGDLFFKVIS